MNTSRVLLALALVLAACPPPAVSPHACAESPCSGDRSVCTVVDGAAACSCRQGFEDVGGACVLPGPCASNPCTQPNRSVCVARGAVAVCQCDSGFRDDGSGQCAHAQTCNQDPCTQPGRGVCSEAQGVVACACDVGLRDDGLGGCVSASPCASNPCTQPNRGVCTASGATAICQCDMGFVDDGSGACVAAASCAPANPCAQPHRTACSVSGTLVVCACDVGYRLDAVGQCVPMQACSPNPCPLPNRGVCTESSGVAVCGCDVGFHDEAGTCVQNDRCLPNPCTMPHQSACAPQVDAGVSCACDVGYQPGLNGCEPIPPPSCANQHAGDAFEPDECPLLARPIASGQVQSRTFSPAGDVEFVSFAADAGAVMLLEETGTLATNLTLFDSDGVTALVSQAERMHRKLPHDGTYFVRLSAQNSATTGATTLQLALSTDDQPDTRATANVTLTPTNSGAALAGRFDFPADSDCVVVPVQANRVYQFEETTAADVVHSLLTATGTLITTDSESLRIESLATEPLFLCSRAFSSTQLVPWNLKVTDLGVDDQADDRSTTTQLNAGASLAGNFEYPGDTDCVAVPVQADHIYSFEETTATDVYQAIYTATGIYIGTTDNEVVRFENSATQALFLCMRAFSTGNLAPWSMRVIDLGVDDQADDVATTTTVLVPVAAPGASRSGTFGYPGDVDCVAVPVQANRVYGFDEPSATDVYQAVSTSTGIFIGTTDSESLRFETSTAQTLYLCIRAFSTSNLASWTMTVTDFGVDDQPDDQASAYTTLTPVAAPGASRAGRFEVPADVDCLAVPVVANRVYGFEETTTTDITQSLASAGATVVGSTDAELVRVKAPASETLFWCVRAFSAGTLAAWALTVTDLGPDDHGDDRATASPLAVDAMPVPGALQFAGDADFFAIDVTSVLALRVVTTGVAVSVQVQSSTGVIVAGGSGPGTLAFAVPSPGRYFVRVLPPTAGPLGAYTLAVGN